MIEQKELEQLAIGGVLRSLRKEQDLTLADVGTPSDIKASHLSLVERGKIGVSLPTLFALLQTLGIGKADFMAKVEEMIPQLLAEKKKRIDGRSFHEEMISMQNLLEQVEKEAQKTKNDLIVKLCARIRNLFPDWLSIENIDSYLQQEETEDPSSFSSQKFNEV